MQTFRPRTGHGRDSPGTPPGRRRKAGWLPRALVRATVALCGGALLLLALGFFWFVATLPTDEVKLERSADGIVALTGGASRITDALELLAAGRGQRLLISGVNRATNAGEISRLHPEFASMVHCCVDLDRSLNTIGNAIETRRWAEQRKVPLADRGDLGLSHAARDGRDRASASGRGADAVSGGFRKGAVGAMVVECHDRPAARFGISEVYRSRRSGCSSNRESSTAA